MLTRKTGTKVVVSLFFGVAFNLLLAPSANANLLGDTIIGNLRGVDADGPAVVVDPGVEFTHTDFGFDNDIWTADFFADDTFTLKVEVVAPTGNIAGGSGQTWIFTDLDWGTPGEIVGVNLIGSVGDAFANPGISFGADSITITQGNLGLSYPSVPFTSGTFEIITNHIPEPSTVMLFVLSILGLANYRFQK